MFHVKRGARLRKNYGRGNETYACCTKTATAPTAMLLPDAEIAEDDIEKIFDIDASGDPGEGIAGPTQVLGTKFNRLVRGIEGGPDGLEAAAERGPVTGAGNDRRLGRRQFVRQAAGEKGEEVADPFAGDG